jgi:cobalt/nickel transport system permease protein
MHMPDGLINAPVSIGAGVLVAGAVAVSLKKTKGSLDSQTAPMAGLVAVFIFAAQMINFPVAAGTSGHLMGGALAAILVGPWVAVLVMTVVVGIQALVFADGGLSALPFRRTPFVQGCGLANDAGWSIEGNQHHASVGGILLVLLAFL